MQNPNPNNPTPGAGSAFKDDLAALKTQSGSARETLHDARDKVQRKAGEYASEAKAAAFEQAEGAQKGIGETIAALGGAMRAASDHLAQGEQNTMSKLMNDAAGGVERFSDSLKNKKFDEILDDVRQLGRNNSGALFAGSILAGLALGRFVKSSVPKSHASDASGKQTHRADAAAQGRPGSQTQSTQWNEARADDPSRSFADSGGPAVQSGRADPWLSRQQAASSPSSPQQGDTSPSKTNIFGEGSGEKLP
jgi:hypothetical protein